MDAQAFVKTVPGLLAALRNTQADEEGALKALRKLRVRFVELLHTDMLKNQKTVQPNAAGKLVSYLLDKYREFHNILLHMLKVCPGSQLEVWQAIMECARSESVGYFGHQAFCQAAHIFLTSKQTTVDAIQLFVSKFLGNWDVRYFWLKQTEKVCKAILEGTLHEAWQDPCPTAVLLAALSAVEASLVDTPQSWCGGLEAGVLSTAPMKREGTKARRKRKRTDTAQADATDSSVPIRALWASRQAQVAAYSDAWLAFLRVPIPERLFKSVLPVVTTTVITHMKNPVALSDFLARATDQGGLVGILALQGLFILVTQHGLEHPDFYKRLYTLLTPQVFTARYRVKFLQLVDIFLASSMVPAYSAAAFAKKFARLSVTAPPVGALSCLAFVHNLIRRHPSCMCLVHRPSKDGNGESADPYDMDADDMDDSKGVESTLWELSVARVHLDPTVAAFARRFDLDVTDRKKVAEVDMQSILTARYKTQVHEALDKKLRTQPVVSIIEKHASDVFQLDSLPGCSAGLNSFDCT